jgi:hypothetical protein
MFVLPFHEPDSPYETFSHISVSLILRRNCCITGNESVKTEFLLDIETFDQARNVIIFVAV